MSLNIVNATYKGKGCSRSDPINVVFKNIDVSEIEQFLTDPKQGWSKIGRLENFLTRQFISDPKKPAYRAKKLELCEKEQDIQFKLGKFYKRLHIRLWSMPNEITLDERVRNSIIAGVHIDILKFPGYHCPGDFEEAKKEFTKIIRDETRWNVKLDAVDLEWQFLGGHGQPWHNGKATQVVK